MALATVLIAGKSPLSSVPLGLAEAAGPLAVWGAAQAVSQEDDGGEHNAPHLLSKPRVGRLGYGRSDYERRPLEVVATQHSRLPLPNHCLHEGRACR